MGADGSDGCRGTRADDRGGCPRFAAGRRRRDDMVYGPCSADVRVEEALCVDGAVLDGLGAADEVLGVDHRALLDRAVPRLDDRIVATVDGQLAAHAAD